MPTASYIPSTDSGFSDWLLNFSTRITATPTAFGLTSGDAVIIAAQNTAYQAAYLAATNPATRTPVTVAAKDTAKASALAVVRPYAMQINANSGVTDAQRSDLGLTVRKTVPTPVPPPLTAPTLLIVNAIPLSTKLAYKDPANPVGKAKPYGVIGVQVASSIGTVAATDPAQASYDLTATKAPFARNFESAQQGKICTMFARWVTRGGPAGVQQFGPWSAPLVFVVM